MKKIFRYLLLFIAVYIIVELFVGLLTRTYYKDFSNYEILMDNPKIEVTESKVAKNKGYIQGTATNNSSELMQNTNLRFEFYNSRGTLVGIENKDIAVFNVGETLKFDIKYQYEDVAKIKISMTKENV